MEPTQSTAKKRSRFWIWIAALAGLPLLLFAVSIIPWRSATLLRPEGTIRVVDESGNPVVGARVIVRRYRVGPPPRVETHRFVQQSDTRGLVRFEMKLDTERIFPLLMHGVPQWGFEVCATKPAYRAAVTRWLVVDRRRSPKENGHAVPELSLTLATGSGECPWAHYQKGR